MRWVRPQDEFESVADLGAGPREVAIEDLLRLVAQSRRDASLFPIRDGCVVDSEVGSELSNAHTLRLTESPCLSPGPPGHDRTHERINPHPVFAALAQH
jgi:hypothetical protein